MKQEEYSGIGAVNNLENILSREKVKKIFLVTGKKSLQDPVIMTTVNRISNNYDVSRFSNFSDDDIKRVENGILELHESKPEIVIAIGGGKVMDTAKLINIISANGNDVIKLIEGANKISRRGKKFIAIPTTAGSGSEATHFAVVYKDKEKFSVASDYMLPDIAIVDPQFTFAMPAEIAAISGIDALCQAIESHWSVNSNEESKKYSAEAISLILTNLNLSVTTFGSKYRINMSRAANLAGKAINITKTTAPHALSYSLTSYFGIPHGQAVSLTLPEFLKYNYSVTESDSADERGAEFVKKSVGEIIDLLGCRNVIEAADEFKKLMTGIGLKTRLSEFEIKSEDDLKIIEDNINYERLGNNPRRVTKDAVQKIVKNIL